jgi:tetratricopeptide (TPR) repeat protein
MKNLLILILIIASLSLNAQIQKGIVREINSNKKPLSNVYIKFKDAIPTTTNDSGEFRLMFSGKKVGDLIFCEEIKKQGYEIVNKRELETLKISQTRALSFDIILAKIGVIAAAKREYYDVSDKALRASYNRVKNALREQVTQSQISQMDYIEQMKQLQERYDRQRASLDELAEKFARVNFDDVSDLYREALQLFKDGQIEEAIKKLEDADLIARTNRRLAERERLRKAGLLIAEQKAENDSGLRTDINYVLFQIDLYDAQPKTEKQDNSILYFYDKLGQGYQMLDMADSAVYYFKLYNGYEKERFRNAPTNDFFKNNYALSYYKLGQAYQAAANQEAAIKHYQAFNQLEKELCRTYTKNEAYLNHLMLSYIVRSDLYIYQADLEKGKVCLTEAKQFFMALLEDTDYEDLINQHLLNIEDRLKDFD